MKNIVEILAALLIASSAGILGGCASSQPVKPKTKGPTATTVPAGYVPEYDLSKPVKQRVLEAIAAASGKEYKEGKDYNFYLNGSVAAIPSGSLDGLGAAQIQRT